MYCCRIPNESLMFNRSSITTILLMKLWYVLNILRNSSKPQPRPPCPRCWHREQRRRSTASPLQRHCEFVPHLGGAPGVCRGTVDRTPLRRPIHPRRCIGNLLPDNTQRCLDISFLAPQCSLLHCRARIWRARIPTYNRLRKQQNRTRIALRSVPTFSFSKSSLMKSTPELAGTRFGVMSFGQR